MKRKIRLSESDLRNIIIESVSRIMLSESFKSNKLRSWFNKHGGVMKRWEHYPDTYVPQDGLGDVTDDDIVFMDEYDNDKEALHVAWQMRTNNYNGQRHHPSIQCLYTVYRANDGYCLLVGLDKSRVETDITWGGERTKKSADRSWRDDKDPKSLRMGRYIDDSDTYYYSQKGRDFGLRRSDLYKPILGDKQRIRDAMTDKEWEEYQKKRTKHMDDYLKKYYGKGLRKRS